MIKIDIVYNERNREFWCGANGYEYIASKGSLYITIYEDYPRVKDIYCSTKSINSIEEFEQCLWSNVKNEMSNIVHFENGSEITSIPTNVVTRSKQRKYYFNFDKAKDDYK